VVFQINKMRTYDECPTPPYIISKAVA
jgi:hypothetical protein